MILLMDIICFQLKIPWVQQKSIKKYFTIIPHLRRDPFLEIFHIEFEANSYSPQRGVSIPQT